MPVRFFSSGRLLLLSAVVVFTQPQGVSAEELYAPGLAAYLCKSAFDDTGRFAFSVGAKGEATASTKVAAEISATHMALDDCETIMASKQYEYDMDAAEQCRERGRDHGMGESDMWCEVHPTHGFIKVNGCVPSFDLTRSKHSYCKRIILSCTAEQTITASDVGALYGTDATSSSTVLSFIDKWTCRAVATGGVYHSVNCGVQFTVGGENELCSQNSSVMTGAEAAAGGPGL